MTPELKRHYDAQAGINTDVAAFLASGGSINVCKPAGLEPRAPFDHSIPHMITGDIAELLGTTVAKVLLLERGGHLPRNDGQVESKSGSRRTPAWYRYRFDEPGVIEHALYVLDNPREFALGTLR